jgi:type IV secretion system protein VirB10
MTENSFSPPVKPPQPQQEPGLRRMMDMPKGVLQKNLKTFVYLGAALLVIMAALFSSSGKKTTTQQGAGKGQPPQPILQDNTDSNVEELRNQLQAERQKEQQATMAAAAMGDAPAAGRSRGLRSDRCCRALHSGPALPARPARQHADATHACATADTVDRSERTRTG